MKDEFLKAGDLNVVIVDWSGGNLLPYTQATANTRVVGAQIASVIKKLIVRFICNTVRCTHTAIHSLAGKPI